MTITPTTSGTVTFCFSVTDSSNKNSIDYQFVSVPLTDPLETATVILKQQFNESESLRYGTFCGNRMKIRAVIIKTKAEEIFNMYSVLSLEFGARKISSDKDMHAGFQKHLMNKSSPVRNGAPCCCISNDTTFSIIFLKEDYYSLNFIDKTEKASEATPSS
jgi:hypothetical protein